MELQITKPKRNHSLDLLRIIAMILVLVIHLNLFGGFRAIHNNTAYELMIKVFDHLGCVAVNVFIILSAWFMREKEANAKRVLNLLFMMLFWAMVTTFVAYLVGVKISLRDAAFLIPFFGRNYEFLSGYLVMYVLSPYINRLLNSLEYNEQLKIAFGLFIVFSLFSPITSSCYLQIEAGYSFSWFIILYVITSVIKYSPRITAPRSSFLLLYIGLSLFSAIAHFYSIPFLSDWSYNNPIVTIGSFSLFLFFQKIEINNIGVVKVIGLFAPCAIAVFLIHSNFLIERWFQTFNLEKRIDGNLVTYLLFIPSFAVFLYIVFSLFDFMRRYLFDFLGINRLIQLLSNKIEYLLSKDLVII